MSGDQASGWTLLPDVRGARVHRPDPDRDGVTLCGRQLDPRAPIHDQNPGFDPCEACIPAADPAGAADVAEEPATSTAKQPEIWPAGLARTWETPGWVRLDGAWAAHRPHPKRSPGWTMCGQSFDPATVPIYRRRPKNKPPCVRCAKVRDDAIEAERSARQAARSGVRRAVAPRRPDLGTLRSPRWVVLPDGDGSRAHRPNPELPAWAMCGARLPTPPTVYWKRPANAPACAPCQERLHEERVAAGIVIETVHITDPEQVDRLDRARARGVSIRTVSGGLPTLGRDR